jgi:hypothetical protein
MHAFPPLLELVLSSIPATGAAAGASEPSISASDENEPGSVGASDSDSKHTHANDELKSPERRRGSVGDENEGESSFSSIPAAQQSPLPPNYNPLLAQINSQVRATPAAAGAGAAAAGAAASSFPFADAAAQPSLAAGSAPPASSVSSSPAPVQRTRPPPLSFKGTFQKVCVDFPYCLELSTAPASPTSSTAASSASATSPSSAVLPSRTLSLPAGMSDSKHDSRATSATSSTASQALAVSSPPASPRSIPILHTQLISYSVAKVEVDAPGTCATSSVTSRPRSRSSWLIRV